MNAIHPAAHPSHLRLHPHTPMTLQPDPADKPPEVTADNSPPDELDNPRALKKAFAERCNWQELAAKLRPLYEELANAFPGELSGTQQDRLQAQLASRLTTLSLPICEGSSYYQTHNLAPTSIVKLHAFLSGSGLNVPKTLEEVLALYQLTLQHVHTHPLGNFSGALSWPNPLTTQDKQNITDWLNAPGATLPGLPLADKQKGVLGYLLAAGNLSDDDLKKPSEATEALLSSASAQALGRAIETRLGGIATHASANDYLLAAIHLGLDPESQHNPAPNSVAGFDLGQRKHWGQSATQVIAGLSQHLVEQGRASPPSADLAARLLLARTAPEHLVKNIPPSVTYGSITWTQLAIAAAKLETQSPGRVLTMSYSQVLAAAETVDVGAALTQRIQRQALGNWGVANGLLIAADAPPEQMLAVQNAFNSQQSTLQAASTALAAPVPNREAMALEKLREAFPGVEDSVFKAKDISKVLLKPGRPGKFPGVHSMLDIVMQGDKVAHDDNEHWVTENKRIPILDFCEKSAAGTLTIAKAFDEAYKASVDTQEKGHTGVARYLISTLPPEDKMNFEYGQLEFFKTDEYKIGMDFTTKTLAQRSHTLDVKITRGTQVNVYRIDTRNGTISKHNYLSNDYSPPYDKLERRDGSKLYKTVQFNPFADEHITQSTEKPTTSQTPQVFNSPRTDYIAKVLINALDLNNDDPLQHARGMTSYDKSAAADKAIGEFFLDLIPFRSAIVNFSRGNVGEGLLDLSIDVVGLLTLGAGKAAQASKVFAKGVSGGLKTTSKVARFIGGAVLEALNPLGGAGDLLRGASRLAWSKGRKAVNVLKGASGSYDLLKAAGKQHGAVAVGIYKLADRVEEGAALLHKGRWYDYNVAKGQPYGPPVKNFQPRVVAAADQIKVLDTPELRGYEVTLSPDQLRLKGLQANLYVGPSNKEYVKINGKLYQSKLVDGQRVVQHPSASKPEMAVRDLGADGWELSSSANRLLGGENQPAWKLDDNTYIVPVDDVRIGTNSVYPYTINYQGTHHVAIFDTRVGAWSSDPKNDVYFWRSTKNKWKKGPLEELKKAKPMKDHNFRFIEVSPPPILQAPINVRPLPKDIHYFWAGGDIPAKLVDNMVKNAEKMPGFNSIVHIDADTPELFQAIKLKLEKDAPGITLMNLHEDDFFQSLKTTEPYTYFRRGQGQNLAAASDVARYPLMNKYGGIYLDTDDLIKGAVGSTGLNAGDGDIMVGRPVAHMLTDHTLFFNTSHFATQPGNPVIRDMVDEMSRRFTQNKAYFEANRPTLARDAEGKFSYTEDFITYERKVFDSVGPNMFNDVLKTKRPDIYDVGFDGRSKETKFVRGRLTPGKPFDLKSETRQYYADKGLMEPDGIQQTVEAAKKHYLAFGEQLQIQAGGEHSWIDT